MRHQEGDFSGRNGLSIHWQAWMPPTAPPPTACVVVSHGLGEHGGRYRRVAEHLLTCGYATYAIDHRGHGSSGGRRAYVDRLDNTVADLDELVGIIRTHLPGVPLFLLGHSMGGGIALKYAIENQRKLDGLMLSGPAVALDGASSAMLVLSKMLSIVAPSLGVLKVDPSAVSRDPTEVAAYDADPLNFHAKVPARTLGEIVHLVETLPPRLPQLTLPLLLMHGTADKLAGVSGSEMVFHAVNSTDKTLKLYEGLYHELFNEYPADRTRVFHDMSAWIAAHIR